VRVRGVPKVRGGSRMAALNWVPSFHGPPTRPDSPEAIETAIDTAIEIIGGRGAVGGVVIYAVGLAAAVCLGLGFVLQQHAARTASPSDYMRFRLLIDLLHKPIWIAGVCAMVVGQLLSGAALANADVSLVEPMLTANLLFALIIAHLLYRESLGFNEWAGALLLSVGVAMFIVGGQPSGGDPDGDSLPRWVLAMGLLGLTEICIVAARRHVGVVRSMLLATGAGLLFGIQDGLTRRVTKAYNGSIPDLFLHWSPYALVAIGVVGLLLAQSAFEAGPLRASLPAITAAEPLAGIAVGIVVFQEHLRVDPAALTLEVCGLVAMVAGVLLVGTSGTFTRMELRQAMMLAHAHGRPYLSMHVGHAAHRLRADRAKKFDAERLNHRA
jgi:drug/metabolite transporter (DMT)-like permease